MKNLKLSQIHRYIALPVQLLKKSCYYKEIQIPLLFFDDDLWLEGSWFLPGIEPRPSQWKCRIVTEVMFDSVTLWLQPTRLLCPWGFSRQEYWSGFPCPPPGDLPDFCIVGRFFTTETLGKKPLTTRPPGKSLKYILNVSAFSPSLLDFYSPSPEPFFTLCVVSLPASILFHPQ